MSWEGYIAIFLCTAIVSRLLLVRFAKSRKLGSVDATLTPARRKIEQIDPDRFVSVMATSAPATTPKQRVRSAWRGLRPHPNRTERQFIGFKFSASSPVYENCPTLDELHHRYFVPRVGPRAENWEDELVEGPFEVKYPFDVDIVYQRELPGRQITIYCIVIGYQGFYLNAYCHTRQAKRRFRLDSVTALIDSSGLKFDSVDDWIQTLKLRF